MVVKKNNNNIFPNAQYLPKLFCKLQSYFKLKMFLINYFFIDIFMCAYGKNKTFILYN